MAMYVSISDLNTVEYSLYQLSFISKELKKFRPKSGGTGQTSPTKRNINKYCLGDFLLVDVW